MTMTTSDKRGEVANEQDRSAAATANDARFAHETDRFLHGFYMVSTRFLHRFPHPQDAQPPLTPSLAPPEKTLFPRRHRSAKLTHPARSALYPLSSILHPLLSILSARPPRLCGSFPRSALPNEPTPASN